jgi:hypothetical protein
MKIETITVMQRKNLGNYEHIEISASAKIEEGDDNLSAILALKTFVETSLTAKAEDIQAPAVPVEEVPEPKEKKARVKKTKEVIDPIFKGAEIPPVIETPKNIVTYNRDIDTHRQLLSFYLSQAHPNWKGKEGVKDFSASLVGKAFLDDNGSLVTSFKNVLSDFFNA